MKTLLLTLMLVMLGVSGARAEDQAMTDHAVVPLVITRPDGSAVTLSAEMAVKPQTKIDGLMNRTSMPANSGMLFLFDQPDIRAFWMKDTLIPLDMIFIAKDGHVVNIHANAVPKDETPIKSSGKAAAVLEINGGRAAALGLQAGDVVHHEFFGNALAVPAPIH